MRVLLVSANREMLPQPVVPLGVLAVASALRDEHDVRIADLCFEEEPATALRDAVREARPDVVGFGIRNLHTNAYDGTERLLDGYRALVEIVRAETRAPIVLGGAGFSLRPETLLADLGADHGVVGEGERAFPRLVGGLAQRHTMPRIVRGDGVQDETVTLGRSAVKGELDRLPQPAKDLVDPRYYAYDGTDAIQTKRGCAFACTYCDYPDLEGHKVRLRDPEAVADDVVARSRVPGVTHAFFVDSVFNVPRSHALALCSALESRGAPLPWVCYVSPTALGDDVVAAMARAGCVGAEIGTDGGSDESLRRLNKPFCIADVVAARAAFARHGISDCHTFVLGAQGETAEDARRTLAFVDELDPDIAVFVVFMEDRESRGVGRSPHRDAILELLAAEAPRRAGWVVPELGVRFGAKVNGLVKRMGLRGPAWLHLARRRRRAS
jgi:radical SAM superfamily enzyme YgiQ (UPF0313 family)